MLAVQRGCRAHPLRLNNRTRTRVHARNAISFPLGVQHSKGTDAALLRLFLFSHRSRLLVNVRAAVVGFLRGNGFLGRAGERERERVMIVQLVKEICFTRVLRATAMCTEDGDVGKKE